MCIRDRDESKIPEEKRHLLYENYHPLFVYRQKMAKQADAILGMLLYSNYFTNEELKRNYDFYQTVTLHHSSLSTCIFGILASQIGYDYEAYKYFSQSATMDLEDMHNNFYAGIHAANMAGTWQGIVFGFAGVRSNRGYLEINPKIPNQWNSYEFNIQYKGSDLSIKITKEDVTYQLLNDVEILSLIHIYMCIRDRVRFMEFQYQKKFHTFTITKTYLRKQELKLLKQDMQHGMNSLQHVIS